jgi:hypothetical protein
MGAYPLEDHKLVHRQLGITRLVAFDLEEDIVARQNFNKPIETCHCILSTSDDLITNIDRVLAECSFSSPTGVIFWLDYTSPRQIGQQIREFQTLLGKLRAGDLVRVTVYVQPRELADSQLSAGRPLPAVEKRKKQFQNLKSRIGEYLPSDTSSDDMTSDTLPIVISKSFGAAALKALPVSGENVFCPLSIVRYADGDQMLSITGTLVARDEKNVLLDRLALRSWPFFSEEWGTVHKLLVPALTVRERLFLERGILSKPPSELAAELGFKAASDIEIDKFLESYKQYYRFYPLLLPAEV